MSDYAASWELSRSRFLAELEGLSDEQLHWRLQPGALTLAEAAMHVAGVEVSFSSQLLGIELDVYGLKLKEAATEGVVNEHPFPYDPKEMSADEIARALDFSQKMLAPLIQNPSPEVLSKEIKSALGPMITGAGAFARFGFHAAYHQGQAYLIKNAPGFPT